ncbi:hypothetical protein PCANC_14452 [Puccinia coronata f. sp. avenae]|uniref:Uncharacterized protein n=1 Tax=Puccinia coronata f. sp. avenae TaxID=200324 RepID=A0A2N5USK0_9BASI|nr:hypothetical protein PCANC_14452 [Puccinia coronata f. sp. avenae]
MTAYSTLRNVWFRRANQRAIGGRPHLTLGAEHFCSTSFVISSHFPLTLSLFYPPSTSHPSPDPQSTVNSPWLPGWGTEPTMARKSNPPKSLRITIPNRSASGPLPQSPPPQGPLPQLTVSRQPIARVNRRNAIRRPPAQSGPTSPTPAGPELKDIILHGPLVDRALGLPPPPPPPPPSTPRQRTPLPPMRPSNVDYNTLPLPPIPDDSATPRPRRAIFLLEELMDNLMDELRNLQLEAELTQDDPT